MPLVCQLFTMPLPSDRLEACLVNDGSHIAEGEQGDHVTKIQIALNRLSEGPGRENFNLLVDGIFGSDTGEAVAAYKNAPQRRILQPWQTTADKIVGKRTIASLDTEMDLLENESFPGSDLIALSPGGTHNHSNCPTPPRVSGFLYNGHADHRGTPLNPNGHGLMINIYGEGETDYLGFTDYATEPSYAHGRPLTSSLPNQSASDICVRSAPLSQSTITEIQRIAMPLALGGCRFTYGSNIPTFTVYRSKLWSLGKVVQQCRIQSPSYASDPNWDLEVWVVDMT